MGVLLHSPAVSIAVFITLIAGSSPANIQINSAANKYLLVRLRNDQTLDCFVTGYQSQETLKLVWTYPPATNIEVKPEEKDTNNNTHLVITIKGFSVENMGTYMCRYTAGTETNQTAVEISYVNETKMGDEFFFNNKSATLKCSIDLKDASPLPEWSKDNKPLSQLENPERFKVDENGILNITKPKRSDAGTYIARFNVSGNYGPTYDCAVLYEAGPLVLDMEKSKNVVEDDNFDLKCIIKGYPEPTVTWLKDGKTVAQDKDHISLSEYYSIKDAKLSVKSAKFSDGGTYTCNASLDGQISTKAILVRVKDNLDWLWPIIGIICEAIVLGIVIFICSKFKKTTLDD